MLAALTADPAAAYPSGMGNRTTTSKRAAGKALARTAASSKASSTAPSKASANSICRDGPSFDFEEQAFGAGQTPVAGIDEAGRGPWAGPVVAAAVILRHAAIPAGLDDSKVLDPGRREELYAALIASGAEIGVGIAEPARIDRMNILQATMWAMSAAVARLPRRPAMVLVDGNRLPKLACPARAIISGDALSLSIAAASIVAKVTRDRLMMQLAETYPGYGFERHKGYGTPEHKAALDKFGACPQHRRSFRPVRLALDAPPLHKNEARHLVG